MKNKFNYIIAIAIITAILAFTTTFICIARLDIQTQDKQVEVVYDIDTEEWIEVNEAMEEWNNALRGTGKWKSMNISTAIQTWYDIYRGEFNERQLKLIELMQRDDIIIQLYDIKQPNTILEMVVEMQEYIDSLLVKYEPQD